jgi:competence protein ComGF
VDITKTVRQSRGFTIIEMLIVLSVVLLIVSFFPILLDIRWLQTEKQSQFNRLEWQVLLQQLKQEMRESRQIASDGEKLYLYKRGGEEVCLEQYGSFVRRRVNSQGNEIVLQSISSIQYKLAENGVEVMVIANDGKRYSAFICTFFPIKVKRL